MNSIKRTGFLLPLILAASLSSCAVEPWERGNLAKSQMALDPYPKQKLFRSHSYSSREAGAAQSAGTGGGCGCY